jgi:hypothetical protein
MALSLNGGVCVPSCKLSVWLANVKAENKGRIAQVRVNHDLTLEKKRVEAFGNAAVSAIDGSMYVHYFGTPERSAHMIARHSCVP